MKTITIRLSDMEAAMLVEAQKKCKIFRDLQAYIATHIREEHNRLATCKAR